MTESPAKGTLFVVGTPIGNLEDITLRAIRTLAEVDAIAAEDTRVTSKLCARHGISAKLESFREQNATRAIPRIIQRLLAGADIALVTDAGTPSISDPGVDLVAEARKAGISVTPVPGPSALATALSAAGLKGRGARFIGFLPRGGRRREECIRSICCDPSIAVLYESPHRIGKTLQELAQELGPRQAVVMRELTKRHEEIVQGTLEELKVRFSGEVKGEISLVIEGWKTEHERLLTDDDLKKLIRDELARGGSAKDIANALSRNLGISRKKIYNLAVDEIKNR
jgi:16S rRNA (cytidine1402-2'-O)-methyltransferase